MLHFVISHQTRERGGAGGGRRPPVSDGTMFFAGDGSWPRLIKELLDRGDEVEEGDTLALHGLVVALRKLTVQLWCITRDSQFASLRGRVWRCAARLRLLEQRCGGTFRQPWHGEWEIDAGQLVLTDVEYDWARARASCCFATESATRASGSSTSLRGLRASSVNATCMRKTSSSGSCVTV